MQRLDKVLSEAKVASRKQIRALVRAGAVSVDGRAAVSPEEKVADSAVILVHGEPVARRRTVVLKLYKPAGYLTATEDRYQQTVMELIPERYRRLEVAPVGRLDKQTEGLLLLTNDGALAHRLISPRYQVEKVYYAEHEGMAGQADVQAFAEGLTLGDGTQCLPARLEPLGPGKSRVTVCEGKYHQVRRMFASRGMPVKYLRRESEGPVTLEGMQPGDVEELPLELLEPEQV